MGEAVELHGSLRDGHPCKLILGPSSFVLEVASHSGERRTRPSEDGSSDPVVVSLADGQTATLKGLYPAPGTHSYSGGQNSFALQRIGANQVLVGPRPFEAGELVNEIRFQPTNELIAQFYTAHRGHVSLPRTGVIDPDELFRRSHQRSELVVDAIDETRLRMSEFTEGNVTIVLGVLVREEWDAQGRRISEGRTTRIAYQTPVPLQAALFDMMAIINFYSFIVGEIVAPKAIQIECVSSNGDAHARFDFHARYREGKELYAKEAIRCLISHPIDGSLFEQSLRIWVRRREEWGQTYYLASESLALAREISRHRYLDAAGWLESIPEFYLPKGSAISREIIAQVVSSVRALFAEKGVDITEDRVRNLLAPLGAPSFAMRLRAAMAHIRLRFGPGALPERSEALISKITGLRGRLAHGENPLSAYEARDMDELTFLLEVVCSFLMLSELPWDLDRLERAHWHPLQHARANLFEFGRRRRESN
jgi:hypothetical protein